MADTQVLFGRYAKLTIGLPGQEGKVLESIFKDKATGQLNQGLRFTFKIEKTAEPSPNKASIEIYNLNEDSIKLLQTKGCQIILEAGYGGILSKDPPISETIFKGDVIKCKTDKHGPDYVTLIENGDGIAAYQTSNFQGSFAPGTGVAGIVDSVINSFTGLAKGEVSGVDGEVLNGATFSGASRDIMDQISGKTNTEWSVQDGLVLMLPINSATSEPAVLLQSVGVDSNGDPINTGLIGSPTRSGFSNSKEKKYSGIEFTALLQPGLKPGRRVRIDAKFVKGDFIIRKVTHIGDTRQGSWQSQCEGAAP
jgi:hypothetical protein